MYLLKPRNKRFQELISLEDITRIHLLLHIVQTRIIAISHNSLGFLLEFVQVIHHTASKECAAIFQRRFIYYYFGPFGFDSLHDALNGTLAKVVGIAFHRSYPHNSQPSVILHLQYSLS